MAQVNEELPILVAQAGPLNGQRWMLQGSLMVGRDETCDIIVPSRQVSRYHARITITSAGAMIEDLASKNGTHCNGQPVEESQLLQDGDVIQIALAQQFIYLSSDATLPLELQPAEGAEPGSQQPLLRLDKRSRRVWIGSEEIVPPLSVSQFQLLELLYDNPDRVLSRSELIQAVWDKEDAVGVSEQALDALIRRLRDRLAAVYPTHVFLVTVRGHGLRLDNPLQV